MLLPAGTPEGNRAGTLLELSHSSHKVELAESIDEVSGWMKAQAVDSGNERLGNLFTAEDAQNGTG